jgi:LPXTG-site transpeptidase (sortase) family protein
MAINSYKKAPVTYNSYYPSQTIEIDESNKKQPLTLGRLLSGMRNDLVDALKKSKVAGFLFPLILIILGYSIIFNQLWPDIEQKIKISQGYYDSQPVPLVAGDYFERTKFLSNPDGDYFKTIAANASSQNILKEDTVSNNYRGNFIISIPSLELNNLPVTANVDSSQESVYRKALLSALAHFETTGLPISDVDNNIVIYGHSSSGDYYERTKDIAGAFSRLNKIKVGDIVSVEMEGKTYNYRINKTKIVEPYNTEIITGTPGKRTLTLFTCFPNGNSAQRFVAVANPI